MNKFDNLASQVNESAHKVANDMRANVAPGGFFRKPFVIGALVAFVAAAVAAAVLI